MRRFNILGPVLANYKHHTKHMLDSERPSRMLENKNPRYQPPQPATTNTTPKLQLTNTTCSLLHTLLQLATAANRSLYQVGSFCQTTKSRYHVRRFNILGPVLANYKHHTKHMLDSERPSRMLENKNPRYQPPQPATTNTTPKLQLTNTTCSLLHTLLQLATAANRSLYQVGSFCQTTKSRYHVRRFNILGPVLANYKHHTKHMLDSERPSRMLENKNPRYQPPQPATTNTTPKLQLTNTTCSLLHTLLQLATAANRSLYQVGSFCQTTKSRYHVRRFNILGPVLTTNTTQNTC